MSWFRGQAKDFYCAFCKTKRTIHLKKHVGGVEISLSLLASIVLMFLFFQKFDFRIIPIFALAICFYETLIQIQYRLSLACPHCGFDPILYLKSQQKACEVVKAHLEKRKQDPEALLKAKPLNLPKIKKSNQDKAPVIKKESSQLDIRL